MVFERPRRRESQQSRHNSGRSIFQRQYLSDEEEQAFRNRPRPKMNFDYLKCFPDAPYTPPVQEKADESSAAENEAVIQEKSEEEPNRTGLPDRLKTGVENLSGYSLDDVRVHYNSPKPLQFQAHAYTQGTDIHVAPGQVKHLPHETWHVVQQMQGRVKPTMQMKGVQINDDEGLEREADAMGAQWNKSIYDNIHKKPERKLNKNSTQLYVIQRITEEDARQARFTFSNRATAHGYTRENLQTIMQHRYQEINIGNGRSMLIGQGTEENNGLYGQILYNCVLDENGIYRIHIYHAHGQGRMG